MTILKIRFLETKFSKEDEKNQMLINVPIDSRKPMVAKHLNR